MTENQSSVELSRNIPAMTKIFLYVQAGGRCQFDGCNRYLLEHEPTGTVGNYGEQGHIYAFKESAARGNALGRPKDINSLSNLILLCAACHHTVDVVSPELYPAETLKKFKRDHEERVYALTGLSKDRDTIPIVLRGLVQDRHIDISGEEMQSASALNYLKQHQKIEIDLTGIADTPNSAFWQTAAMAIDRKIERLYSLDIKPNYTLRVSVFALAPIPLLVYLGSKLSDKMHVDLYQRHRDPETWTWKDGPSEARYISRCLIQSHEEESVSLLVNLSGKNNLDALPNKLRESETVYELTLEGQEPSPLFLNTREDLQHFTSEYNQLIARIRNEHPKIKFIHLFPAVPAPVAITIGRSRLPKVDPLLVIYDRDKRAGGFVSALKIT